MPGGDAEEPDDHDCEEHLEPALLGGEVLGPVGSGEADGDVEGGGANHRGEEQKREARARGGLTGEGDRGETGEAAAGECAQPGPALQGAGDVMEEMAGGAEAVDGKDHGEGEEAERKKEHTRLADGTGGEEQEQADPARGEGRHGDDPEVEGIVEPGCIERRDNAERGEQDRGDRDQRDRDQRGFGHSAQVMHWRSLPPPVQESTLPREGKAWEPLTPKDEARALGHPRTRPARSRETPRAARRASPGAAGGPRLAASS